ncbi:helix-turn-helix transcriptional regulator [Kocuria sp. NPDC057446]|uniref:helix-turn-helix transcriptional regulator n=1 Tax=Kocuria sp. NPDC057446 TaxID=3346137 RepID=UPI0036851DC1
MPPSSRPGTARASSPAPGHSDATGTETPGPVQRPPWTLLTNHGHVLLAVAQSRDARVAEIAARVSITTRATLAILRDLEDAGYLTRHRVGRRSHYTVDTHQHFRHPATASHEVGELLAIFIPGAADPSPENG